MTGWIDGYAVKAADETHLSPGATIVDSDLFFSLTADQWYRVRLQVFCYANLAAAFRWAFLAVNAQSGMLFQHGTRVVEPIPTINAWRVTPYTLAFLQTAVAFAMSGSNTAADRGFLDVTGIFQAAPSSPGNFEFQWSQQAANATPATVFAGSWLTWEEIESP